MERVHLANRWGASGKEGYGEHCLDVVSELNNMISGNLFSLLNRKAKYAMTRPKAKLIWDEEKRARFQESGRVIHFQADNQQIDLDLELILPG